ncbi:MAG: hypothetical protein J5626_08665 [Lachnospiraceae bacterium]|nr:hypothetical protein [Lachnospiraceae bacterium]
MNTLSFLGPFEIHSDSADTDYYNLLDYYTSDLGYEDIPLMSVLYNPGLITWLIAALVGLSFYRRDYKLWLAALPMLLFLVSLFLGPVALVRYIYPLILLVPFTGFLMIYPVSET